MGPPLKCLLSLPPPAACPPDQVSSALDCEANEALISWRGQPQMNSYTAIIVDENQGLLSCSTTNTSCAIPNLKCGQYYTVTVSHHDGMCPSMPSEPIYMESGKALIRTHTYSRFSPPSLSHFFLIEVACGCPWRGQEVQTRGEMQIVER